MSIMKGRCPWGSIYPKKTAEETGLDILEQCQKHLGLPQTHNWVNLWMNKLDHIYVSKLDWPSKNYTKIIYFILSSGMDQSLVSLALFNAVSLEA